MKNKVIKLDSLIAKFGSNKSTFLLDKVIQQKLLNGYTVEYTFEINKRDILNRLIKKS